MVYVSAVSSNQIYTLIYTFGYRNYSKLTRIKGKRKKKNRKNTIT